MRKIGCSTKMATKCSICKKLKKEVPEQNISKLAGKWMCLDCQTRYVQQIAKERRRSMATEVATSDTIDIDSETKIWS